MYENIVFIFILYFIYLGPAMSWVPRSLQRNNRVETSKTTSNYRRHLSWNLKVLSLCSGNITPRINGKQGKSTRRDILSAARNPG